MHNTPLVSVIVPLYNVEKYIGQCVESILKQSYENFEIVLVDDGSTDNSSNIIDRYGDKDTRVKVFHKPNGGISDARNFGLEHTQGEYITFVDSDDFVGVDYLKKLVDLIFRYSADISIVSNMTVGEDGYIKPYVDSNVSGCDNTQDAIKNMCIRKHYGLSPWAKLYKKSLFEGIRYPIGRIHEDLLTTPYIFSRAKKIAYSESIQLYYRIHNESIMHRPLKSIDFDVFEGLCKLVDFVDDKYPEIHDAAVCRFVNDFYGTVVERLIYQKQYKEKANELKKEYAVYLNAVKDNSYISKNTKLKTKLFMTNVMLYKAFYKLYSKIKREG